MAGCIDTRPWVCQGERVQNAAPILFVLIWSTGFIVARAAVPHGGPELILLARMLLTAALLAGLAAFAGERLPRRRQIILHLLAGVLLNGIYLCTSWWAVKHGMPAGVMSLLGSLQPLVIAVASFGLLGERLAARGWMGLAIGLIGVSFVLEPLLVHREQVRISTLVIAGSVASVLAMAAGTMIQRGSISADPMKISGAVQNFGGAIVALFAMLLSHDYRWDGAPALWLALAWSVFGLSAGALTLLVWMTRNQGATRVSALLLLVPPLAAVEAWVLFGERLGPLQLVGFALALGGVVLVRMPVGNRQSATRS